jgi:hypothetical protein
MGACKCAENTSEKQSAARTKGKASGSIVYKVTVRRRAGRLCEVNLKGVAGP